MPCIFYRGDVHPEWNFHLSAASATARNHKGSAFEEEQGSHTNPASSSLQLCFLGSRPQGGESNSSGPTPAQHQGRRRSVRWTECVTSPLGQGGACWASFLTRHTQRPRHKKVSDDTDSETHTCTKHNTDTSGNSESVRAPRAARSTTRDCSHTSLCCSRLIFAHHLPPRPPSLW